MAAILFIPCLPVPVRFDGMNHGVGTGGTILHVETIISRRIAAVEHPFELWAVSFAPRSHRRAIRHEEVKVSGVPYILVGHRYLMTNQHVARTSFRFTIKTKHRMLADRVCPDDQTTTTWQIGNFHRDRETRNGDALLRR